MNVRPLFTPPLPPSAPDAAQATPPAGPGRAAPPTLSDAEQAALAERFPEAPALTLRLYGPQTGPEPTAPLGSRLDLRA